MADEERPPPSGTLDDGSSATASSGRQSNTSGSTTDRIFPISSAVGIDPLRSQSFSQRPSSKGYVPPSSIPAGRPTQDIGTDATGLTGHHASSPESGKKAALPQSDPGKDRISTQGGSLPDLVTSRFKYVDTEEGHCIITGVDSGPLTRCEDEPIHIPGAVQAFGLLVALQEQDEDQLVVRIASENSQQIIGYSPGELFKLNSFCDILTQEQQDNLLDHIDFIRDEETDPASNGPDVFTMSILTRDVPSVNRKLWCAIHINPVHSDLIICEFELDEDETYPLVPSTGMAPETPEDTLDTDPTDEEYIESTFNTSKPLRVLRSARKRRGEAATMEVYNIMSQVQDQLSSAPNLERFLKILVGVVKELTGFHRVMIYQFDSHFHGRVVTELVDPRATKDLYRGLHFPASDIPKQARDLYKINKVRLLYDRDLTTARLVCRSAEDLKRPLDLTFSYLRAMSPIHLKYLANMAVRSSMSISINAFDELWGLISCHSYGSKGMRVSFPIRNMCRLIGDTASRNIERLSYASRLQARKLINTVPTEAHPSGYILVSSDDLLELFDADFGLLTIRNETKILGQLEQSQEVLAMVEYLRLRKFTSVLSTQDIREDFPDIQYHPGFSIIAGLLLVPLNIEGDDFIVLFRRSQTREVKVCSLKGDIYPFNRMASLLRVC
jgi:light-regulated signal transduction histidine kinase (bacteriophytochrome)